MHADRRLDNVLQHRQMGIEVELLEHHADLLALKGDFTRREAMQNALFQLVANLLISHHDRAAVHIFQMVDAAQEGRFARTGRPEDHHHLAGKDVEIDPFQYLVMAVTFMDVTRADQRRSSTHKSSF